jgi:hypothetical protein
MFLAEIPLTKTSLDGKVPLTKTSLDGKVPLTKTSLDGKVPNLNGKEGTFFVLVFFIF